MEPTPTQSHRGRRILTILGLLIVLGYLLFPPLAPLEKANLVGYSICHRIPERSFHLGSAQLPLCARCTGTYLGVAIAFVALALLRRLDAAELLPTGTIILLVGFVAIMGFDGLNSYLSLFPNLPHLYTPHNWLRAATGSLNGIALSLIVLPVFNFTLWKRPRNEPPLPNLWPLPGIVAASWLAVAAVSAEPPWLLYPVSLITATGVLWMLTMVNTMMLLIVLRRDSRAETWRDALPSLLGGLVVALVELTVLGALRYLVTGTMEWPL